GGSTSGTARAVRGRGGRVAPCRGPGGPGWGGAAGTGRAGGAGGWACGASGQVDEREGGRISGGAIVERGVPTTFARDGYIYLEMNNTDFGTAQNVVAALNRKFGQGTATALDGRVVQVRSPMEQSAQARFLSQVEDLQVTRAPTVAKVIINARTGSVVMNRTVMIEEAAVAHGNLSVIINRQNQVSQPDTPFTEGQTVVVPNTQIEVRQDNGSLQRVTTSANLADVVKGLNALGATPQDLLAILQAMKSAGALRAELEII
ncbi:flagellar basal body P-ring protein FlgI, partial [Achromobacter ruhlandii]|uniref:flagellar basal body P-ring protein FlgI n=1 Tax=Achromobacter ruhlandii TaxID=72557 RepID=UPI0020163374